MPPSVRAACFAVAVVLLSGCAPTAPTAPTALVAFPFELLQVIGGSVAEPEVAALAPVEAVTVPNRHVEGATDTYRTYLFDRTRVRFLDARPQSRLFVESVKTWDPAVRTPAGIGVGSTRSEVEAAYGPEIEAQSGDGESAHYYSDADGLYDERLYVVAGYDEADRVRELTLLWDID